MINEERLKLMVKMASYEEGEGKRILKSVSITAKIISAFTYWLR